MIPFRRYCHTWKDGGQVKFIVLSISDRMIRVRFGNGVKSSFSVGSPLHTQSRLIDR